MENKYGVDVVVAIGKKIAERDTYKHALENNKKLFFLYQVYNNLNSLDKSSKIAISLVPLCSLIKEEEKKIERDDLDFIRAMSQIDTGDILTINKMANSYGKQIQDFYESCLEIISSEFDNENEDEDGE